MTTDPIATSAAAGPTGLRRSRKFLWALASLLGVCAIGAWVSLGVGLYLDVERSTRLILAVVAAVATEVLFWTCAAALGVSVFEARKRIWRRITGRG